VNVCHDPILAHTISRGNPPNPVLTWSAQVLRQADFGERFSRLGVLRMSPAHITLAFWKPANANILIEFVPMDALGTDFKGETLILGGVQ
jgi:hypothetical protein